MVEHQGAEKGRSVIDDGRRRDEEITRREAGVITKCRREKLDQPRRGV